MKSICVTTLLLFFASSSSHAQVNKYDIGIEGGPSLVTFWGPAADGPVLHPVISYSGGMFLQFNGKKKFSLRTGVNYERKGMGIGVIAYNSPADYSYQEYAYHYNLDYILVPVLARFYVGRQRLFFVNAGPYAAFLMAAHVDIETFTGRGSGVIEITDSYKRWDIGASAGAGFNVPLGEKFAFSLEVRNNLGLLNIFDAASSSSATRTNSFNLLLGIGYKLSPRS